MITYIEVTITQTASNRPADQKRIFHTETIECESMADAWDKLTERYGKKPHARRGVFVDKPDGSVERVGFLHSFWNADLSHWPVQRWHQTDWVTFSEVTRKPVHPNHEDAKAA